MKLIVSFIFCSLISLSINAQEALAKIEYGEAETAFQNENYQETLNHLEKVKELLKSTNATVMYLEIMASYKLLLPKVNNEDKTASDSTEDMMLAITQKAMSSAFGLDANVKTKESHIGLDVNSKALEIDALAFKNASGLANTYLVEFKASAPIEKVKGIYTIQQELDPIVIDIDNIILALKEIKVNSYTLAIALLEKACTAGNSFACSKKEAAILDDKLTNHKDDIIKGIENNMVLIEGSTFIMGDDEDKNRKKHKVTLSDFYINKYELTRLEWMVVMGKSDLDYLDTCFDCPKTNVNRAEIIDFIEKLNGLTGEKFNLPTEAQWEYAAIGGNKTQGFIYAGSNDFDEVGSIVIDRIQKTGLKMANELGLYDMTANVSEICYDLYSDKFYNKSNDITDPICTNSDKNKIISNGEIEKGNNYCYISVRSSYRYNRPSNTRERGSMVWCFRDDKVGFRLAQSITK